MRSSTHRDGRYILRTHGGRRLTSKGRMGARQAARVGQLVAHARDEMEVAALAAGWRADLSRVYWWPPQPQEAPQAPQEAPQAPQEAPQAPQEAPQVPSAQEAPQEAPQAPSAPLLPWQGGGYISERSRLWTLDLDQLATLKLYHHERSGRWEWLIVSPKSLTFLAASGGPGYTCYSLAERAMLLALAAVLHPAGRLPASLPPQEGGISAARREG